VRTIAGRHILPSVIIAIPNAIKRFNRRKVFIRHAHWDVNFQLLSLSRQAFPSHYQLLFWAGFCVNIWKWLIFCLGLGSVKIMGPMQLGTDF
jgi:hypothetical protein